jgi:hypothetical protein
MPVPAGGEIAVSSVPDLLIYRLLKREELSPAHLMPLR